MKHWVDRTLKICFKTQVSVISINISCLFKNTTNGTPPYCKISSSYSLGKRKIQILSISEMKRTSGALDEF